MRFLRRFGLRATGPSVACPGGCRERRTTIATRRGKAGARGWNRHTRAGSEAFAGTRRIADPARSSCGRKKTCLGTLAHVDLHGRAGRSTAINDLQFPSDAEDKTWSRRDAVTMAARFMPRLDSNRVPPGAVHKHAVHVDHGLAGLAGLRVASHPLAQCGVVGHVGAEDEQVGIAPAGVGGLAPP